MAASFAIKSPFRSVRNETSLLAEKALPAASSLAAPRLSVRQSYYGTQTSMEGSPAGIFRTVALTVQEGDDESGRPSQSSPALVEYSPEDASAAENSGAVSAGTSPLRSNSLAKPRARPSNDIEPEIYVAPSPSPAATPMASNSQHAQQADLMQMPPTPVVKDESEMRRWAQSSPPAPRGVATASSNQSFFQAVSLADLVACLPLNVTRHRDFLRKRLGVLATNPHLFYSRPTGLGESHVELLVELLRGAYQNRDERIVAGTVAALKLVLEQEPELARLGGSRVVGVETSLFGLLVKVAACLPCYVDAAACLRRLLQAGTAASSVAPPSPSSSSAGSNLQRLVSNLDFVSSVVHSLAIEVSFSIAYDNFAALLPTLLESARRVPSTHETWQALGTALGAMALRVRPSVAGRSTGCGNGLFLPATLPLLRAAAENNKACRPAVFGLLGSLTRLHPQHVQQLHAAGLLRLATDFVLHSCVLSRSGLGEGDQALLSHCLDFLSEVVRCTPHGAGTGSGGVSVVMAITADKIAVLGEAIQPRHSANPAYRSLLKFAQASLPACPALLPWLLASQRALQDELRAGLRVASSCQALCSLWGLTPGLPRPAIGDFIEALSAAFRAAEEGQMGALEALQGLLICGDQELGSEAAVLVRNTGSASDALPPRLLAAACTALAASLPSSSKTAVDGAVAAARSMATAGANALAADAVLWGSKSSPLPAGSTVRVDGTDKTKKMTKAKEDEKAHARSTITAAYVTSLLTHGRAFLHPVRFFSWPTMATQQLHARLLGLLALSRLHPRGLRGLYEDGPGPDSDASAATGNNVQTDRVALGELAGMLQSLLTGASGRVAAPSAPHSTVFTHLVVSHSHTSLAVARSLPGLALTVLLLLTDILTLPPPLPAPLPDPLPVVRAVVLKIEQLRLGLLGEAEQLSLGALLRFLAAAARTADALRQLPGAGALSPALAQSTPAAIVRCLEACNDVFTRNNRPILLRRLWALLREPGLVDATSTLVQSNDLVAAALLRWTLFGLRYRDAGTGDAGQYSLAEDSCWFLQQLGSDAAPQPQTQSLYRYLFARPEVDEALLDVARHALRWGGGGGERRADALVAALGALCTSLDMLTPVPYLGYDCPGLFFPTDRAFPLDSASGERLRAPRKLLLSSGLPQVCVDSLVVLSAGEVGHALRVWPVLLVLAARWADTHTALAREPELHNQPCFLERLDLEWVQSTAFPLALALLRGLQDQQASQLYESAVSKARLEADTTGPARAWAAWDAAGGAACELLASLLEAAPGWMAMQLSPSADPSPGPSTLSSGSKKAQTQGQQQGQKPLRGQGQVGLRAALDAVLDLLPDPLPAAPRRLQAAQCIAVAAAAGQGCDVASDGRGTAALALLESAAAVASSTDDSRLHAAFARVLGALSRSSDSLRDVVVGGPLLRFLVVVLQHCRGPALLPRSVALRPEDARVLVDVDVLHDGCAVVLACQAAAALSNTASRAQRLSQAALPEAVLWLMAKHPTYRDSLKMQRVGLAAVLAVWNCRASRQSILLQEGLDDAVTRAADLLDAAVARGRWDRAESSFVRGMVEQVRAHRSESDCLMS